MEIVGIDHVYLAVTDFDRSMAFYDPVMKALGFFKGDRAIAGERHAHYDYYATIFEDPDGIRHEIVARRALRDEIVREWSELRSFVNPLQELRERRRKA